MSSHHYSSLPKKILGKFKSIYRRLTYRDPYKGNQVQCPICNSQYARFAPYGASNRPNARCLKCGSAERHRLLWLFLHEKTDFFSAKGTKLLHFAPEQCFFERFASLSNIDYYPCDIDPDIFPFDKNRIVRKVDITSIPLADNSVDTIICNHVLEHIPDDRKAMAEMYRVLKKGGWGIFQVPIDYKREETYEDFSITSPEERRIAFGQFDHVRWYGQDYKDRLASVGFEVSEDRYVRQISPDMIARYRIKPNEFIYYCKK